MRKCVKTRLQPLHTLKNIVLKNLILVVWEYAQMQQNTFSTTLDVKNIFFKNLILVVWKYAHMHENTFLTTSDVKKYLF